MKLARSFASRLPWCLWALDGLCASSASGSGRAACSSPRSSRKSSSRSSAPIASVSGSRCWRRYSWRPPIRSRSWRLRAGRRKTPRSPATRCKRPWKTDLGSCRQVADRVPGRARRNERQARLDAEAGDAFLADQKGVMDAVQRLRAKAKAEGNLASSKEQKVTTAPAPAGSSTTTIIEIAPTDSRGRLRADL